MTRTSLALPLIYAIILTLASCSDKNQINSGAIWGTTYHITYSSPDNLGDSILTVMNDIELQLSMFASSSLVSRINRNEDVSVGDSFRRVFEISQKISALSDGAFDPTVGPLTDLWGFGNVRSDSVIMPENAAIDAALSTIGINRCTINNGKVIKPSPDTRFDFSSVAKGYGVDEIARMLSRNGVKDYLVEIGGEIIASGHNPKRQTWRVQIDAPVSDSLAHISMYVIPLDNAAVATSGNYRNFRKTTDGSIGHTIDPRTGYPVRSSTLSATVISPDCATADALATACMVLPSDKALEMIEKLPGAEVLLAVAAPDSIKLIKSSGFPKNI